jgi:hypothetical protein
MAHDTKTREVIETDTNSPLVVDPNNQDALEKIEQSKLGEKMKRALKRVAGGEAIRAAAELEGYASHADVYRAAKRYGLANVRTTKLIESHRRISSLAGEELEDRLLNGPESFSNQQLGIIQGISTDKALAHEKTQQHDGSGYISALEQLAKRAYATGEGIELKVSVKPLASGADEVIDATPER